MRLTLVFVGVVLLSSSGTAQKARQHVFAGLEVAKHGLDKVGREEIIRDVRVVVRGAQIVGVRSPTPFDLQVILTRTAEGGEALLVPRPESHGACRGEWCGTYLDALEEWLELAPMPVAGICPGPECKIVISAEFTLMNRHLRLETRDFILRSAALPEPARGTEAWFTARRPPFNTR